MTSVPESVLQHVSVPQSEIEAAPFSARERNALDAINRKVGARDSLPSVIDFLAESTRDLSPCDRYSVAFVEEGGRRLVSHHTKAFYEPVRLRKGYAEDLTGSSLQEVIDRGTTRLIHDLQAYAELRPDSRSTKLLLAEGVRSSMTCPLKVEGRNIGVMFRSARRPNAYNVHQVRLHQAVAERLGQVVEKTYRIEQLAEANRAYFETLGFVTHELKSPVGSMLTEANLMLEGYVGEITPDQRKRLERLVGRGKYLLDLVGEYLNLSRIEGGRMELDAHDDVDIIADVIEPAIDINTGHIEDRDMTLERDWPDDLPSASVDPQLLKIVCVNLLSNAAKYGREGGQVRVSIRSDDRLHIAVWNEGTGWPEDQQDKLFRRFSRIQTPELLQQKGSGIGLYTSWRIVNLHGGRISARSQHHAWAEFRIEIPQPLPAATESESA